jgi:hypothetical protein
MSAATISQKRRITIFPIVGLLRGDEFSGD